MMIFLCKRGEKSTSHEGGKIDCEGVKDRAFPKENDEENDEKEWREEEWRMESGEWRVC